MHSPIHAKEVSKSPGFGDAPRRINEIGQHKRAITADTALRLSRYFGTSEPFWINLQAYYDLEVQKDLLGDRLAREVVPLAKAG